MAYDDETLTFTHRIWQFPRRRQWQRFSLIFVVGWWWGRWRGWGNWAERCRRLSRPFCRECETLTIASLGLRASQQQKLFLLIHFLFTLTELLLPPLPVSGMNYRITSHHVCTIPANFLHPFEDSFSALTCLAVVPVKWLASSPDGHHSLLLLTYLITYLLIYRVAPKK